MTILEFLNGEIEVALNKSGAPEGSQALVMYASRPEFGDYQANGVMAAAKKMKMNPRELAEKVISELSLGEMIEKVELAGPGFINIFIRLDWLANQLESCDGNIESLLSKLKTPETVVVDYSGPNLAKEMHVGHLRSTIIGDAFASVLDVLGDRVVRQNHVGDWGTQFGMLIALLEEQSQTDTDVALADLENFYREAKKKFDSDLTFAEKARKNVVALQSGDADCRRLWQKFIDQSMQHCFEVYQRLGVSLTEDDTRAESFYNDMLPEVIIALENAGMLKESQGAKCVFLPGFENKEGQPLPIIVQKSDGGYLYATSDLAAINYRAKTLKAERVLYFVDARQSLHFDQVFTLAKNVKFAGEQCSLEHMPFGTMLGEDKRPFKTRSGDLVKLQDLLDEAVTRAYSLVNEKQADMDENQKQQIAQQVGIGAVKYADLSKNRTSDYVFNWDNMLSFEGNTAPYLQYAYARIQSIFRKLSIEPDDINKEFEKHSTVFILEKREEKQLALKMMQMPDMLLLVAREGYPHYLCKYLYELTQSYMSFYETCPVIKAETDQVKHSRLYLCLLTANSIKLCLDILGIDTPPEM